jgi:hypothetical protein
VSIISTTLIIVAAAGAFAPTGPVVLKIVSNDSSGHVVVIATASNETAEPVEFCGRWGFEVEFDPNDEGEQKILAHMAHEEQRRLSAEANGKEYFSRCGPRFTPTIFDIGGLSTNENWIKLAPGESYSDTIDFVVKKDWYEQWPGSIEVRNRLDLCESSGSEHIGIPANGSGGSVIAVIPVP